MPLLFTQCLSVLLALGGAVLGQGIRVPYAVPDGASEKQPSGFLGFSIEMAGFVDFSGN
jgi:hypothetical protein